MSDAGGHQAIRRLREESRLRIAGQNRRRSFAGWCAIATLASGISLAALDAHEAQVDAQVEAEELARQEAPAQAAVDVDPRFLEEELQLIRQHAHKAAIAPDLR